MERPQVRVLQQQQEVESTREVTGSEAEDLLRKYGHGKQNQQFSTRQEEIPAQTGLTFEEMLAQQESKEKETKLRLKQQMSGPKPITFNGQNGYDVETKYSSDEDGIGFNIQIITDIPYKK